MNNNKVPDRLNISKDSRRIIEDIDKYKFLNLDTSNTSRAHLFSFAMAIGLEMMPIKLKNIHPGGLILDSTIDPRTKSLMYSYIISLSRNKDTLDEVTDKDYVYTSVQEIANTGFKVIDDYIKNNKEEELVWSLLKELDKQYEENIEINVSFEENPTYNFSVAED